MESLDTHLKNLFIEYNDTDIDEVAGWDPVLTDKILNLYSEHGDEFFTSLKTSIWELDYNSGIVDFLDACVIGNEYDYKSNAHLKMLLDIFDNHPDENKRVIALNGMIGFKHLFLSELEDRYENEKSMRVRNKMGAIIVGKICRLVGCENSFGASGQAYKGNIDRFNELLRFNHATPIEDLKLIELLRDLKYIPNNMRAYLECLAIKLKGDQNK